MRETIAVIVTNAMVAVLIIAAVFGSRWCKKQDQQVEQTGAPSADESATKLREAVETAIIAAEARLKALYRRSERPADGER